MVTNLLQLRVLARRRSIRGYRGYGYDNCTVTSSQPYAAEGIIIVRISNVLLAFIVLTLLSSLMVFALRLAPFS